MASQPFTVDPAVCLSSMRADEINKPLVDIMGSLSSLDVLLTTIADKAEQCLADIDDRGMGISRAKVEFGKVLRLVWLASEECERAHQQAALGETAIWAHTVRMVRAA